MLQTQAMPFIVTAWSFTKADTIADLVATIYGKVLNFIKTESITGPCNLKQRPGTLFNTDCAWDSVNAIYRKGPKLYLKKIPSQP